MAIKEYALFSIRWSGMEVRCYDAFCAEDTLKGMEEIEADFLLRAIERYGSADKVAKRFQVNRSTVFRKIRKGRKSGQTGRES